MTLEQIHEQRKQFNDLYFDLECDGQEYYESDINAIIGSFTIGQLMADTSDANVLEVMKQQRWTDETDGVRWALEALGESAVYKRLMNQMPDHVTSSVAAKYTSRPALTAFERSSLQTHNA